jgi:rod shape-determining protein MreC
MSFIFLTVAITLFAFSALRPASLQAIRTGTADIFTPVLAAFQRPVQAAADYVRAVSGLAELQEENARLRSENLRLREWYRTALVLQNENQSLQNILKLDPGPVHSFVTARIVADSGNTYFKSLLVLSGGDQNVSKGEAVLSGDGLVGRIIEAGDHAARVLLLTDINSRIPVIVQSGGERAILGGSNDDLPVLDHLPLGTALEAGTKVITSGDGGLFPYGLPVGEVVKNADGSFAVRPYAALDRLTFVRILSKGNEPDLTSGKL